MAKSRGGEITNCGIRERVAPPCLVGIESCASSHHWSRELQALGHTVRLMPPAYVKPYVKRHKNDATDAEAICEAVTRANMRFVATKTPEQQSCLTLHRARHLFIRQQTSVINAIRAHLAEFGILKLKSSSTPITPKDLWCAHAVGSSSAPLLGSTAAEGLPRIGKTSIARRWHSCASPQSASCSENFVIPFDVPGQTLRKKAGFSVQ